MARGLPDYGSGASKSSVAPMADMAELAARLGSSVVYDRRGDVVWLETFANGIESWNVSGFGTGNAQFWSAASSKFSGFCLELVADSNSSHTTSCDIGLPILNPSNLGVELVFAKKSSIHYMQIELTIWDGTAYHNLILRYDEDAGKLQYYDDSGAMVDITGTIELVGGFQIFHNMKVVWDYTNKKYVRALLNNNQYSLADLGYWTAGSSNTPQMQLYIELKGRHGYNDTAYLGAVIVTQNEP